MLKNNLKLIIISGLPATGKTTLSKKISDEFNLPLVSMDAIKEVMWNSMGHEFDFDFNGKIGRSAFEIVFHFIEASLSKGVSLVVEAHFNPELNNERFNNLSKVFDAEILQIHCDCDADVLRKRFKVRMERNDYHKGHKHTISLYGEERIMNSLGTKNAARLDIDGKTFDLDTTIPEEIDYEKLFKFITNNLR